MKKNKSIHNQNNKNEIRITRIYDAPVKAVWDAWTDPAQVAKWWGPRGFTITTRSKDLRVGGSWDYTMHGPDGTDYPNLTKYHEVEKYSRLVYDHGGSRTTPALFRVTVNFKEIKDKTKMDMTMSVQTAEALEEIKKIIKTANGNSTWDRLAEFLEKETSGKEIFIINRSFDAPIETLYEMWVNPKHLTKWLSPAGTTMEVIRSDVKPGGSTFYVMSNGKDIKMYGLIKYLEFNKPISLEYTQQFCDENEKISRHPQLSTWPEIMLTTVRFTEEDPKKTLVTVTWEPRGNVGSEEIKTLVKMRGNVTIGWTGSFDKLEDYLKNLG